MITKKQLSFIDLFAGVGDFLKALFRLDLSRLHMWK